MAIAALVATCLFSTMARSDSGAGVPVTGGSWYWQEQVGTIQAPVPGAPPLAPPGAIPTPDVPSGDFPVSVVGGQPDKETFLQMDTSAVAQGSTVSSLVLTLHEDGSNGFSPDMATVEARPVTGFMSAGAAGAPWANKPDYDTSGAGVPGKRDNGTWTFDITPIAQKWASGEQGNNGVALVPAAPAQGQTYEVVWVGVGKSNGPTVAGQFTPPAPSSGGAPASAPADSTAATPSAPIPITPDVSAGAAPSGVSTPSVAPTGASTPAARSTNSPVRRIAQSSHRALPWSFFLALILAITLIGASTLSLGDFGEPQPDRRGGVLRALERRAQEVP